MAHLVKDLDDLMIRWEYTGPNFGNRRAFLVSIDPETNDVTSVQISVQVAEILIEHGMSSGS